MPIQTDMRIHFNNGHSGTASNSAFTLIELLIGVLIAAMVYAAVFCGVSTTFRMLNDSRENLRATQILVSRLEGVRLEGWGPSPPTQLFNPNYVPATFVEYFYPPGLGSATNEGTYYAGTMTITTNPPINASYSSNLAFVQVTVTWTNGVSGVTNVHTRTMSTYVAQYGLQNYVFTSH